MADSNNNTFSFSPLDAQIDQVWAGKHQGTDNKFSNYYDYYFSGEDIKVYIDGLFEPENEMDIAMFSYNISQNKEALFGFWSYNYDAMMYGSRIISGQFMMYTRYPRRMTELLEKAAEKRVNSLKNDRQNNPTISLLSPKTQSAEDERNIQKYWAYSQLDRITSDPTNPIGGNKNIFSAHPPFNIVILFGVEEVALSPINSAKNESYVIADNLDRMIYSDVNQRSIKPGNNVSPMKIVIQQVQLTSMNTVFSPGGQPIAENYQFAARDFYFTDVDLGFIKNTFTGSVSDSDAGTQASPYAATSQSGTGTPTTTSSNSASNGNKY